MRCPRCGSEMHFTVERVLDTNSKRFFLDYMFKCPTCFTKIRIDRVFVEKRDGYIVLERERLWHHGPTHRGSKQPSSHVIS